MGLQCVQIHLVPVKIRIVWRGATKIESKSLTGQNLGPVAHNGHSVQRRLSVEQDRVAVLQYSFNGVPHLKLYLALDGVHVQTGAILTDDVLDPFVLLADHLL